MKKVLIVDDESKIREVVKEYAEFSGYEAFEAKDGMEAVGLCKENEYDIVLLDVMMPKLDGYSACKEIRKFSDVPIIILSARGEEYDKLFGFELGVDDYVVKPFSLKELMARINAVLNRKAGKPEAEEKSELRYKGIEVDLQGRIVKIDGNRIELTPKEYELLVYLMRNKNIA
ncbi:MAG: response regulator transcription factor, partial [Eubacteriales bacterium]